MREVIVVSVLFVMAIGFLMMGCGDEISPTAFARRTVYEVTQANITGNGNNVEIEELIGIFDVGGEQEMPAITIYGRDETDDYWEIENRLDYEIRDGLIHWNPAEPNYQYYRIVVIK